MYFGDRYSIDPTNSLLQQPTQKLLGIQEYSGSREVYREAGNLPDEEVRGATVSYLDSKFCRQLAKLPSSFSDCVSFFFVRAGKRNKASFAGY